MMSEFLDFRMQAMVRVDLGTSSLFHHPQATEATVSAFSATKYGLKKMVKQFDSDLDVSLTALKDSHPGLYCFHQFKSGEWSSHCLDFYLMCRARLPKSLRFALGTFVEQIFSPFGQQPVISALSCMKLYDPANSDELLLIMAAAFSSILAGRRHESFALFRRHSKGGFLTFESFLAILEEFNLVQKRSDLIRNICAPFSKEDGLKLTFDEFEVCALYCGLFADLNATVKYDPFASLTDPVFDQLKGLMTTPDRIPAFSTISTMLGQWFKEVKFSESDTMEVQKLLLRALQITWKNKPVAGPQQFVGVNPAPGQLISAKVRLTSGLSGMEARVLSQLLPAVQRRVPLIPLTRPHPPQ
jgi:hypothetical protein